MVDLIPREILFGNPDRVQPRLSPDGKRFAWIAPDEGVLNLWVRDVGKEEGRVLTRDRHRGIRSFTWAEDNRHLLYVQDKDGDENWHLYAVPAEGGEPRDLTPIDGVQARLVASEPDRPDEILVGLNDRNPQFHDIWRIRISTGAREQIFQNDLGAISTTVDHEFRVRAAQVPQPDGSSRLLIRNSPEGDWEELLTWGPEDSLSSGVVDFAKDNKTLLIISSAGSNTGELRSLDVLSGEETTLARDEHYDVSSILRHPTEYTLQAVAFLRDRLEWEAVDREVGRDFEALRELHKGDFQVVNRDHADRTWLVAYIQDTGPVAYYAWDREKREGTFLFSSREDLDGRPLAEMRPVRYPARDGLEIHGYLTLPVGVEAKKLPTVINVHGGPWVRDTWGYDAEAQWFANRGYACLQINYRGSTGYGKKHLNAGNKEWGAKMQDDVSDGVAWLIQEGIADPEKVAIYGGSYGGYAVLAGLTFTPDLYTCGVEIVGPSNLITWMNTIPPYWEPFKPVLKRRVGDPETEREFLESRSPLFHIDRIQVPLFIAQGANDPRVPLAESLQIVDALKEGGKTVEYMEFADEGHGFARPENRLKFYAAAEQFLAEHLGGRCEE